MANQVFVDFVLRGLEGFTEAQKQIRALAQSAKGLEQIGSGGERASKGLKSVADEAARAQGSILGQAKAQAALAKEQGNLAEAVKVFQSAISKLTPGTVAATNAQRELVRAQNQLAASVRKSDNEIAAQATLLGKVRQNAGDAVGALKAITDAQTKLADTKGMAALRLELRKTYLDTNYANSPLIGAIRDVSSQFDKFLPIIGAVSPRLAQFTSLAAKAASSFQSTGQSAQGGVQSTSTFLETLKKAGQAVAEFGKDQGGSASFIDGLLNLQKIAERVGARIKEVFARIKESISNAISGIRQGRNPFAGLFGGGSSSAGAADTAKLVSSLGEAQTAATGTAEAVGSIAPAAGGAALAVGGLVAGVLALAAGVAIVAGIADGLERIAVAGIEANSKFEQTRIGIASVVASVGKLEQNGIELKGVDALNAALPIAQKQLDLLRVDALQTALAFEDIAPAFLQAVGPGLAAGLNLNQIRKTVIDISQLIVPLTGNAAQLGQELRAIFSGEINNDSQVAKTLGITRQQVEAKREEGKLAEFLNQKLAVAAATGKLMAQTFEAARSNLREAGTVLAGQVTVGLFDSLRNKINEVLPKIFETAGDKVNISPQFKGIADTITKIFDVVGKRAEEFFDFIFDSATKLSRFLSENQQLIDDTIDAVNLLIDAILSLGAAIVGALGTDGQRALERFKGGLHSTALEIAFIQDAGELFVASFLGGIKSIVLFIEEALSGALGLVGIEIQSLTNDIKRLKSELTLIGNRLDQGQKNIRRIEDQARFDALPKSEQERILGTLAGLDTGTPFVPPSDKKPDEDKTKLTAPRSPSAAKRSRQAVSNTEASLKQLRDARFALEKAEADKRFALAKAESEKEGLLLEQQLEDRIIGLKDFYDKKAVLIEQDSQREIGRIKDAILAEKNRIAEVEENARRQIKAELAKSANQQRPGEVEKIGIQALTEKKKIQKEILGLEAKLREAEVKGDVSALQNTQNRIRALRDLQAQVAGISVELARATGDELNAALAEIDGKFADTLKTFIANFGEQSAEVQKLLKLIGVQQQAAVVNAFDFSVPNTSRDFAESAIQRQITAGLLSEAQARQQLLDVQRAYAAEAIPKIREQIAELEKLSKAQIEASPTSDTSATRARILDLQRREQDILRATIDPFFAEIKRGLTQDLKGSFEQFLLFSKGGLEDLKNLALGFIDGIKRAISKVLSEQIEKKFIDPFVNKLFGVLGLGGGTDPAELAQTVATNANTAALTANTAALTSQSVAGIGGSGLELAIPATDAAAQQGEQAANAVTAPDGALSGFFNKVKGAFEKFANGLKSIATGIGNGIKSVFSAIVSGFSSIFGSLFGGGSNAFAGAKAGAGFAEGGYTGDGAKFQPAGVVHAGEFVQPANVVNRWGVGFMEAMRRGVVRPQHFNLSDRLLSGFAPRRSSFLAEGGMPLASPSVGSSGGAAVASPVRNIVVFDDKEVTGAMASAEGERVTISHIKRKRGEILQILGIKA